MVGDVTRDSCVAELKSLTDLLLDKWAGLPADPGFEAHQQILYEFEPAATQASGSPISPLQGGEDTSLSVGIPPVQHSDPVASLRIRLSPDGSSGRVELLIRCSDPVSSTTGWIVARFESPESSWFAGSGQSVGEHDYHHVQYSSEVRLRSSDPKDEQEGTLPPWFPVSAVAPPLPATGPVDLVLCAILAVRNPSLVVDLRQLAPADLADRVEKLLAACGATV